MYILCQYNSILVVLLKSLTPKIQVYISPAKISLMVEKIVSFGL